MHSLTRSSCRMKRFLKFFSGLAGPRGRLDWVNGRKWAENVGRCSHAASSASGDRVLPLTGVRVLDLSRVLAGPYCSMLLADLGADVIKVERPGIGDDTRAWGPPFCGGESAYFLCVNRNKRSIAVNLKDPKGMEIVQKLAQCSDVLVENYLPGKLASMGLGFKQLHSLAPRLIYCSITGYGQTGPYSNRAGYDIIAAGLGGLMHITGPRGGEPCKVGVAMTDLSTGLYAHGAIMAALLQRQQTGRGQHLQCDLLSTQVASLVNIASNYLNAGLEAKRHGTAHESIVPYQAFKTSDGYLMVGAGNDRSFVEFCKLIDLPSLSSESKFATNKLRVANREELLSLLDQQFAARSTADWLEVFEGTSIPFGPINNMQQVFSDPQVLHNGMIQRMEHPTAGSIAVPGPAVKYSDWAFSNPLPPPTLGQHTESILTDLLGLDDQEVRNLVSSGVVQ